MAFPVADTATITQADLELSISAALTLVQVDNAQVPGALYYSFFFPNLINTTSILLRRAIIPAVPFDCYVEVLAAEGNDHTAASTLTVALTDYVNESLPSVLFTGDVGKAANGNAADIAGDLGPLANFPIVRSGTVGAGINKIARVLHDNTKVKLGKFTDRPLKTQMLTTLLKGQSAQITVGTTSGATPSSTHVALVLREFFARE